MSDPEAPAPDRVEPRLVKGFRDLLPGELLVRNRLVETVRLVFERYGFAPLETPAVEHLDVLTGKYGDEGTKTLFRLATPEDEPVALRFDLTVPLARVVAQYPDLPVPFRRYQIAPVWRSDKPGPGRFREFLQCDVDIVGSSSPAADVEVLAVAADVLRTLGLPRPLVRLSSRRLLDRLVAWAGVPAGRATGVFRVIDKLDRIGLDGVVKELRGGRVDASGDRIPGLGLGADETARIERFLAIERTGREGTLASVAEVLGAGAGSEPALAELADVHGQLLALGIGEDLVVIDPTLARGLDYYTGPIFEAVLQDAPEFGTVFGGGRYDGLVERFLGRAVPGTGGSLGVSRLVAALLHLGVASARPSTTSALVTVLDRSLMGEYQRMAGELRAAGIAAEVFLGDQKGLKKQLAYADRLGIPVAVMLGGDELARGEVTLKDLGAGARLAAGTAGEQDRERYLGARLAQRSVPRAELVAAVRAIIEGRTE